MMPFRPSRPDAGDATIAAVATLVERRRKAMASRTMSKAGWFAALALVCAATTGCTATTAKLNSFSELSKVGVAYSDAAEAVVDEAATGSIAADTATLVVFHELNEDKDARRKALTEQSKALR